MSYYDEIETEEFPGCCGISVHFEFPDLDDAEDADEKKSMINDFLDTLPKEKGDHLILISLIDQQLRSGWLSVIQKAGFRRLVRFRNSNSGNAVNLFGRVKEKGVPKYEGRPKAKPKKAVPLWGRTA